VNIPGFTADASVYRARGYRGMRVDGARNAFAVEASLKKQLPAIIIIDYHFSTPWHNCSCSREDQVCFCSPKEVITA
jgi:hypothetical protein